MDAGRVVKRLARQTAAFDRSKLDVITGARCASGLAIPLIVGLATGHPDTGAFIAGGALLTAFAIFQPGYRRRAGIVLAAAASIATATLLGGLVAGSTWLIVLLIGLLALGAGLLVALGPSAAMVGLLTAATFLFASSSPVGAGSALAHAGLVGVGGLLETLVIAGPWPHRPFGPERRALAAAYRSLSQYAADIPGYRIVLPSPNAVEDIRTTLASAPRRDRWGRGRAIQALADEALRVRESLGALAVARDRLVGAGPAGTGPQRAAAGRQRSRAVAVTQSGDPLVVLDAVLRSAAIMLDSAASSIQDVRAPAGSFALSASSPDPQTAPPDDLLAGVAGEPGATGPPPRPYSAMAGHDLDLMLALRGQLRAVQRIVMAGVVAAPTREPVAAGSPHAAVLDQLGRNAALLRANLTFGSTAFRHALRLAVAAAIATVLYKTLPGSHEYWIAVATLMVLKPDFATTITRGLGRAAGTLTGAVLATIVAAEIRPGPVALAALVALIAFAVFTSYQTNYGFYVVGLTALTVFFAAFGGLPPLTAAGDRAVDNLIGTALALTIFILWPTWTAQTVPRQLARTLTSQAAFAGLALDGYIDPACLNQRALDRAASAARLDRTNAEAAVERMASEPTRPGPLTTEAADGIIAAVHRLGLAAMSLHTSEGTQSRPMCELAALRDGITATITSLAGALTDGVPPPQPDLRRLEVALRDDLLRAGNGNGDAPAPRDVAIVLDGTDRIVDAVNTIARLVAPGQPRTGPDEPDQRAAE